MASLPPREQPQRTTSHSTTQSATTGSESNSKGAMNSSRSQSGTLSTAYNLVMTPVNFITFLLSLVLIDLRYSFQRQHTHSASRSRLPTWLHTLLYQPYENEKTKASSTADGQWYYHTKQKKLFKMEADEAFKFRGTMLFVLGVASISGLAGLWYAMGYLARLPGLVSA